MLCQACICGHSMGGHGALVLGLRNPDKYRSISAFSAICNPVNAPWGKKAFSGYLGDDKESWKQYDATELAQVSGVGELPDHVETKDTFLLLRQLLWVCSEPLWWSCRATAALKRTSCCILALETISSRIS